MCVSKIMSIDFNIAGNMTTYKDCLYTSYTLSNVYIMQCMTQKLSQPLKKINPVKIIHLVINNRALVDKKRLNGNAQIFLHRHSRGTKI